MVFRVSKKSLDLNAEFDTLSESYSFVLLASLTYIWLWFALFLNNNKMSYLNQGLLKLSLKSFVG